MVSNCPNCGAPVDGKICAYCGATFRAEEKGGFDATDFVPSEVKCLTAVVSIPDEARKLRGDAQILHEVGRLAREELMKQIAPFVTLEMYDDPVHCRSEYRIKLRVLPGAYRFK